MKYPEWYEKYVKGKELEGKIKAAHNKEADKAQFQKYKAIFGDKFPKTFTEYQDLKYNNSEEWYRFVGRKQEAIDQMDFADMGALKGKLGNKEVRSWYKAHDERIPDLIDKTAPVEDQARQACELRNVFRTQARDLMRDQEARRELDRTDPNMSFEDRIADKMSRKGLSRDEAILDILKTASKTRKSVDQKYGLE